MLLKGNVLVAAELLGSLADVAADLHRLQRAEAVAALITQTPQVFPVVRHLLKDRTGEYFRYNRDERPLVQGEATS